MDDLDEINRELAELQDALIVTPETDFETRYAIRVRQAELRELAARHHFDRDSERPTEALLAELGGLRVRLDEIRAHRIDMVSQAGGTFSGGSPGVEEGLNRRLSQAQGADKVRARIGRIEGILIDRGVTIPID